MEMSAEAGLDQPDGLVALGSGVTASGLASYHSSRRSVNSDSLKK